MLPLLLLALLAASASPSAAKKDEKASADVTIEKDEGVFVLNADNYDAAVAKHKYLLVMFYAPWCGHCKAFGPEYVKAAQQLKEKDSPIKFAKVEGPEETSLLEKMGVKSYPTLYFYRDGEHIKYGGGRFANEMVAWVEKKIGPYATPLDTAELVRSHAADNDVAVVGFFSDQESDAARNYLSAVRDYEEYPCGITSDKEAFAEHDAKDGQVILFKKFDDGRAVYEGAIDKPTLLEFIQRYAVPLVIEFNHETARKIFRGLVKSHLLLFVSKSADYYADAVKMANTVARTEAFQQKLMFVTVDLDEDDHRRVIEYLGLKGEPMPNMRIVQMADDVDKYRPVAALGHDENDLSEENVRRFAQDYVDGKVPQHFLTEDLPADWDEKPVKYLTGKNFDEVVFDKTQDVLVEYYAPWCGHCKQLAPIWDQVAEAHVGKVVVAKMDATVNELSHTRVRSFPMIRLYKKDTNEAVEYNGERTLEGISKFLSTDGVYGQAAPEHDEL